MTETHFPTCGHSEHKLRFESLAWLHIVSLSFLKALSFYPAEWKLEVSLQIQALKKRYRQLQNFTWYETCALMHFADKMPWSSLI